MIVGELIDLLKKLDQTMPVAVARDEEGNGFSLLYQVSQEPMEKQGRRLEWSEGANTKEYVVLWPGA